MRTNYLEDFRPIYSEYIEYEKRATEPFAMCIERDNNKIFRFDMNVTAEKENTYRMVERIVKSLLYIVGGYRLMLAGRIDIIDNIKAQYTKGGKREFDVDMMERAYGLPFEIAGVPMEELPAPTKDFVKVGGNNKGCRIGIDLGGSDRKVSAVIDGKDIFTEEVLWLPKLNSNPNYHYEGIMDSLNRARAYLPRVDSIGVSSAGIYVDNEAKVASLFIKVGREDHEKYVKNIFIRAAEEIGAPLVVANDGDVTALAGSMELGCGRVLGIAMGTGEAGGYVNSDKGLNGWLSELGFVPCDIGGEAAVDDWSGDYGCGSTCLSQDAVIRLADVAGLKLQGETLAAKLKSAQEQNESGDIRAAKIFEDIGIFLGNAIMFYTLFYDTEYVLILGRVTSGKGGEIILTKAKTVLTKYDKDIKILMPDEKSRRVGQSIAASTL